MTQAEYRAVMGANPSSFTGDDLPVDGVSWTDAIQYCNARSTQEGLFPAYVVDGQNVSWDQSAKGYSPDLNPIEKLWSKVKAVLRKLRGRSLDALDAAIRFALAQVSADDCAGWFSCAGYCLF